MEKELEVIILPEDFNTDFLTAPRGTGSYPVQFNDSNDCPLARALRRQFPEFKVAVPTSWSAIINNVSYRTFFTRVIAEKVFLSDKPYTLSLQECPNAERMLGPEEELLRITGDYR